MQWQRLQQESSLWKHSRLRVKLETAPKFNGERDFDFQSKTRGTLGKPLETCLKITWIESHYSLPVSWWKLADHFLMLVLRRKHKQPYLTELAVKAWKPIEPFINLVRRVILWLALDNMNTIHWALRIHLEMLISSWWTRKWYECPFLCARVKGTKLEFSPFTREDSKVTGRPSPFFYDIDFFFFLTRSQITYNYTLRSTAMHEIHWINFKAVLLKHCF